MPILTPDPCLLTPVLVFQLPQPHPEGGELLLDFVQAGLAEVLAAEQLVFGAAGELAEAC